MRPVPYPYPIIHCNQNIPKAQYRIIIGYHFHFQISPHLPVYTTRKKFKVQRSPEWFNRSNNKPFILVWFFYKIYNCNNIAFICFKPSHLLYFLMIKTLVQFDLLKELLCSSYSSLVYFSLSETLSTNACPIAFW